VLDDKEQQARCIAAMKAFNAPHSVMLLEIDAVNMYDTAAEKMGKVFISTELAGGGSTTAYTVGIAKKGIRNILRHVGITKGELEVGETLNLDMPDQRCYIFSETSGLVEHCVDLGDQVKTGQLVAKVHNIERTGTNPEEYYAEIDGIYTGRHFPGLVVNGDFLGVIAVPM
jgi:N-alpha-acetyl-L-2,4-diaminobutyrate deacetylase